LSQFRVVRLGTIFICAVVLSTLALAGDRKSPTKLSDLPPEAQRAISSALARKSPAIQHFTLTASDGANGDGFGGSVAIDNETLVVTGGDQALGVSIAYVFVKPPSGWANMTQTAELTISNGGTEDFFNSVAISGGTVVVGSPNTTVNGNPEQGVAFVFVKPVGGWVNMTETAMLTPSDGAEYDNFGYSVSVSGNTVIIGTPRPLGNNPGPGAAYVFVEPGGGWTDMTQTAELSASDGNDGNDFGISVSISGNTAIVGAFQACGCNPPGEAYVFVEPKTGWTNMTETAELTPSDGAVGDLFGRSVSLSGNTAVVGGDSRSDVGAAYVFVKPANGWVNMTQTAELTEGTSTRLTFGQSVAIDGNVILVGDSSAQKLTGAAFVFLKPTGGWQNTSQYNLELKVSFPTRWDQFGSTLAISGATGVIGAPEAPTSPPCKGGYCSPGPGEAFIFTEK
jgi:hypothetical protein